MKKTSRKSLKESMTDFLLCLFIIFTLLYATVVVTNSNLRILATGWKLINISMEIDDYNDATIKTDEMTERINQIQAERQEIYQSDDWIIRQFSTSHRIIKLGWFVMVFTTSYIIIRIWIYVIYELLSVIKPKKTKLKS